MGDAVNHCVTGIFKHIFDNFPCASNQVHFTILQCRILYHRSVFFFQIIIIIVTRMQYRQDDGAKKRKVWNAKSFQEVRIKDIKKEGFYNSVAMLLLALFDSMAW